LDRSYWGNICEFHKIESFYTNDELRDNVIKKLSDAMWLTLDQESELETDKGKEMNQTIIEIGGVVV